MEKKTRTRHGSRDKSRDGGWRARTRTHTRTRAHTHTRSGRGTEKERARGRRRGGFRTPARLPAPLTDQGPSQHPRGGSRDLWSPPGAAGSLQDQHSPPCQVPGRWRGCLAPSPAHTPLTTPAAPPGASHREASLAAGCSLTATPGPLTGLGLHQGSPSGLGGHGSIQGRDTAPRLPLQLRQLRGNGDSPESPLTEPTSQPAGGWALKSPRWQ